MLVTRTAAIALTLTGVSEEIARFQARSAFTGAGFTTTESETIVNHPVRRKIISALMLIGNIGMAGVIASVIATLSHNADANWLVRFSLLLLGVLLMFILSRSEFLNRFISKMIERALLKFTSLDIRDYVSLLHLGSGYVVLELKVNEGDWVEGKPLAESRLSSEGVLVLGIHRTGGKYIGSPIGSTNLISGDSLTLYGPIDRLQELDLRKRGHDGDRAHRIAVQVQKEASKEDEATAAETENPSS